MYNYKIINTEKKARKNDAADLEKFMKKAEPVMLKVLEENTENHFLRLGKEMAQKSNAVDVKCRLDFPKQLLLLFSIQKQEAQIVRISCIHMFESAPQNKMAIAYNIVRPSGEHVYLVLVFSIVSKKFT